MVEIVNRTEKTVHGSAEYIGRPSALGNPFKVDRYTRDEAVEMYRQWLRNEWKRGEASPARHELLRLAKLYKHRGRLKLVCSCAPQRCHGEVVAEAITGILAKGWV